MSKNGASFTHIDAVFFYYRDTRHRPLVTLCRVVTDEGTIGYGWAICGPGDNPCYATGRFFAYGRAIKALTRGVRWAHWPADVWVYARAIERYEALYTLDLCRAHGLAILTRDGKLEVLPPCMQPPRGVNWAKSAPVPQYAPQEWVGGLHGCFALHPFSSTVPL